MSSLNPKTYNLKPKGARPVRRSVSEGHPSRSNGGFAALTSTIIIAAVLLILAVSVASSGFQGRFSIFDGEVKEFSRGLSESCVQLAILKYTKDNAYVGNNDVEIIVPDSDPSDSIDDARRCTIVSVSGSASSLQIRTQAELKGSYTNLEVVVDATNDFDVISWEEKKEFP